MPDLLRTTVLISGSGSNLQALIDARDSGRLDIDIGHVICNVSGAAGLQRAEQAGIRRALLPDVLVYRRLHRDNLSRRESAASREEFLKLVKAALDRKRSS